MANLTLDDVELRAAMKTVSVTGKGRRPRTLRVGARPAQALDRYLRIRARHSQAGLPALWLGERNEGPLGTSGVYQVVRRRAREAGFTAHPHQLRHTFAHSWLAAGGNEGDLRQLAGWKSRQMVTRYASSAAAGRARDAHARLGLGDRL